MNTAFVCVSQLQTDLFKYMKNNKQHTDLRSWWSWFSSVAFKALCRKRKHIESVTTISTANFFHQICLLVVTYWESPEPGVSWWPRFTLLALERSQA